MIDAIVIKKNKKLTFHFISLSSYDETFKNYISSNLISIFNNIAYEENDFDIVVKEIKNWFIEKNYTQQAGFIAEFFCHLYMRQLNYEQHFLFENLEDKGSMKKGFDGLYMFDKEMWLFESKSTIHTSKSFSHNANISDAYNDIKKKLSGKKLSTSGKPITPWQNAIHHAVIANIKENKTLIENLKLLRNRFANEEYEEIQRFNVIPSSTLFLEKNWKSICSDEEKKKLFNLIKNYEYKKMNVICINKQSANNFIRYINGIQ